MNSITKIFALFCVHFVFSYALGQEIERDLKFIPTGLDRDFSLAQTSRGGVLPMSLPFLDDFAWPSFEEENIELVFLKHQQKLNKRLVENSEQLVKAAEQLQLAHKRVMKTNEDIIKFNSKLIESTSEVIGTGELPKGMQLSGENIKIELNKIEKTTSATDKKVENLLTRVDEIAKENEKLSQELDMKRKKITENRELISSLRADLSLWTD